MEHTHRLIIEGDEIIFEIKVSGQAMAVPPGGRTDAGQPFLGATVMQNGKKIWSGVLSREVSGLRTVPEQFADQELERLYRLARAPRESTE